MDELQKKLDEAFAALVEAEKLAYAGGLRSTIGASLIAAHSCLLKAKNDYGALRREKGWT